MSIHSQYVTGRKFVELTHTIVVQEANIFSAYNLCSHVPFEELTATLTSAYALSLLIAEVVASPGTTGIFFGHVLNPDVVAAVASVYSLSTAVT